MYLWGGGAWRLRIVGVVLVFGMVRLVRLYGVEVGGCMGVKEGVVVVAVDFECSSLRGEKWMRKALGYKYQRFPFTGKVCLV